MEPVVSKGTIVIPTYNERFSLPELISSILCLEAEPSILVVDDHSPDGTGGLADQLAAQSERVHVLHRPRKMGLGTAYIEGIRWALDRGASLVVSMDGDMSHDPKYLPQIWGALARSDVVVGSRYVHGISVVNWPLRRLMISQLANTYIRWTTGLRVKDCTSGFVAYRSYVLETIKFESIRSEGYAFLIEMKYRAQRHHFSISETPIIFVDRRMGVSKLSTRVMIEAFWLPWKLAWARLWRRDRLKG